MPLLDGEGAIPNAAVVCANISAERKNVHPALQNRSVHIKWFGDCGLDLALAPLERPRDRSERHGLKHHPAGRSYITVLLAEVRDEEVLGLAVSRASDGLVNVT